MPIHYKEIQSPEYVYDGFTCNRCCTYYGDDTEGGMEAQEAMHWTFSGGYASVFGDGSEGSITLCQHCAKDLLGDYVIYADDEAAWQESSLKAAIYQEDT